MAPSRILLGDNPFIGVDHLSQERSREKTRNLNPRAITRVIDSAVKAGAQGIVCSAHPVMKASLREMKEDHRPQGLDVFLVVPDVQHYIRLVSQGGMLRVLAETFENLSTGGKAKALVGGGISMVTSNPTRAMKTYVAAELSSFVREVPADSRLKGVFLHELITELIVSFRLASFAQEYINFVRDSLGIKPGFVTRNFAKFVEFVCQSRLPISEIAVMTPFNPIGFQMNPSRHECEDSLQRAKDADIIAMSVLAGGYLSLDDAIAYLRRLPIKMSCVVGVSTEIHAQETFSRLKQALLTE
jgi:hypothetical protein